MLLVSALLESPHLSLGKQVPRPGKLGRAKGLLHLRVHPSNLCLSIKVVFVNILARLCPVSRVGMLDNLGRNTSPCLALVWLFLGGGGGQ